MNDILLMFYWFFSVFQFNNEKSLNLSCMASHKSKINRKETLSVDLFEDNEMFQGGINLESLRIRTMFSRWTPNEYWSLGKAL